MHSPTPVQSAKSALTVFYSHEVPERSTKRDEYPLPGLRRRRPWTEQVACCRQLSYHVEIFFGLCMSRYDLTGFECRVVKPLLPSKSRGLPRVDDRRVSNGIFWLLRSVAPWRDMPERHGPGTSCYDRFVRWRKAGAWDRLMNTINAAHDGTIQSIDSISSRAHRQAAAARGGGKDHRLGFGSA